MCRSSCTSFDQEWINESSETKFAKNKCKNTWNLRNIRRGILTFLNKEEEKRNEYSFFLFLKDPVRKSKIKQDITVPVDIMQTE